MQLTLINNEFPFKHCHFSCDLDLSRHLNDTHRLNFKLLHHAPHRCLLYFTFLNPHQQYVYHRVSVFKIDYTAERKKATLLQADVKELFAS